VATSPGSRCFRYGLSCAYPTMEAPNCQMLFDVAGDCSADKATFQFDTAGD
jgi:hypothetical protein